LRGVLTPAECEQNGTEKGYVTASTLTLQPPQFNWTELFSPDGSCWREWRKDLKRGKKKKRPKSTVFSLF